jgi:hypothetical protein
LNHISDNVGVASGLKCCFASTTKGFTALCIQAFTTASNLGVLDLLKQEMGDRIPGLLKTGSGGVTASMFDFSFVSSRFDSLVAGDTGSSLQSGYRGEVSCAKVCINTLRVPSPQNFSFQYTRNSKNKITT